MDEMSVNHRREPHEGARFRPTSSAAGIFAMGHPLHLLASPALQFDAGVWWIRRATRTGNMGSRVNINAVTNKFTCELNIACGRASSETGCQSSEHRAV
eukprot:5392040-Amphidinium_carterae.1